jgi:uncharacterized protein YndB with AHSA1/START domain
MSQDARFTDVINARPEVVFDALTRHDGQEAFYGEPGWFVESACDLRVGGIWTVTFGPARDEVYRHDHVFRVIDDPVASSSIRRRAGRTDRSSRTRPSSSSRRRTAKRC